MLSIKIQRPKRNNTLVIKATKADIEIRSKTISANSFPQINEKNFPLFRNRILSFINADYQTNGNRKSFRGWTTKCNLEKFSTCGKVRGELFDSNGDVLLTGIIDKDSIRFIQPGFDEKFYNERIYVYGTYSITDDVLLCYENAVTSTNVIDKIAVCFGGFALEIENMISEKEKEIDSLCKAYERDYHDNDVEIAEEDEETYKEYGFSTSIFADY